MEISIFLLQKKMFKITKSNWLYSLFYIISLGICLIDMLVGKVEKTHIEFNKNIKSNKIEVIKLN